MEGRYTISRRIEIDAGHRIRLHGSKCRNLHGHRYVIEAICEGGRLWSEGEQQGMMLDFGFMKDEMIALIDEPCDHGFIADHDDDDLLAMFAPGDTEAFIALLRDEVRRHGFCLTTQTRLGTKLYVMAGPPTAENLARHWFDRLAPRVADRSGGHAMLARLRVHETPNCIAEWTGETTGSL